MLEIRPLAYNENILHREGLQFPSEEIQNITKSGKYETGKCSI